MKPLAVDLFCGLGGWTEGLLAAGYYVVGFDVELHAYDSERYPAQLVLQDVRTLHGSQFKDAALIVASPPCQAYSYMAMPWTRAKAKAAAIRADETGEALCALNELFDTCFRIQREASAAAGRRVPMVVENVRGAIPWVGRSRWNFGSYHLWGDVPALMPTAAKSGVKVGGMGWYPPDDPRHQVGAAFNPAAQGVAFTEAREARKNGSLGGGSWFNIGSPGQKVTGQNPDGRKNPGFRFDGLGRSFQTASVEGMKTNGAIPHIRDGAPHTKHLTNPAEHGEGLKHGGDWFSDPSSPSRQGGQVRRKAEGAKHAGGSWFDKDAPGWTRDATASTTSNSPARKAASAKIAKIPFVLAEHVGRSWFPRSLASLPTTETERA